MKENMKLVIYCLRLELDNRKLRTKCSRLKHERDDSNKNNEFLSTEVTILKQINRKRYVQQEDKMHYLVKRNKKLEELEDMVSKGKNWRIIKNKLMED